MEINVIRELGTDVSADLLVVFTAKQEKADALAPLSLVGNAIDVALEGELIKLLASRSMKGGMGERLVFPTFGRLKAKHVAIVGTGKRSTIDCDAVRRLGGSIVGIAREIRARSIVVAPLESPKRDTANWPSRSAEAFVEGVLLGGHRFHAFKGTMHKKEKEPPALTKLSFIAEQGARNVRLIEEAITTAQTLSDATMLARDLVNTPSDVMTPSRLAEVAQSLAVRGSHIRCRVFDEAQMEKMGMHATVAVGRGSAHRPVAVHLSYIPTKRKKRIAVVGKAVTFDSGGLSIKPADSMMTMKIDMAGAAAVIGLFRALSAMKPDVEVHGVFLAVENMPGGSAYRPGDVVKAMDGTTIEVLNTDAEGRLTLADAICYAAKLKPDAIVDLATLTGACVVALGEDIAGLFTSNDPLATKLLDAAEDAGEPMWRMPLYDPYLPMVKSKIADLKNIGGGRSGGAITAALFLKSFSGPIPWAHIDIAGPSYVEKETRADQPYGASGYGVRMLMRYLEKM